MPMRSRARCALSVLSVLAVLVPAASAQAAPCPEEATGHPYVLRLDLGAYFLAPGGDFEGPATSWALAGGAGLRDDVRRGSQVLGLPRGADATSPAFCVDATRTHLRFDVRATTLLGRARADAVLADGRVVPLGGVGAVLETLVWDVSPSIPLASALGIEGDESIDVRLRLSAVAGGWFVDDVLIDPYKRG
jgi:hypothetical protein